MPNQLLQDILSPLDLKKLDIQQLPQLAHEIRDAICGQVSQTGGHLAPNLGVVELTIALHYVFDFSTDRLLFDVGHQCYPHKLLTGRLPLLNKLRQKGGMSGFPQPSESPYDLFSVGHAGTAISTAVGMARGDQINGEEHRKTVALIGDSSIVNGVAMEGLNNAGTLKRQMLIVLNDNGMSIAKPQGAIASYFDQMRTTESYAKFKDSARSMLSHLPGGSKVQDWYHRTGEMAKAAIMSGHMFEQFGLLCVGPTDGHDLPSLIKVLEEVKTCDRPILLHVQTTKGKGYNFATNDPTTFHSPKPFTVQGDKAKLASSSRSFTSAYADAMINIMNEDEKIIAVTAAMPDGTGLNKVQDAHPHRTLDVGICESHAIDMCAGMAKTGLKPFFAVYSTFAQRGLDQIFQEVSLQNLPVRICMDRAGFVGGDGAVHHGFMDIAMFKVFPKAVLLAPSDEQNLIQGLQFMKNHDDSASFIRYPRDSVSLTPLQKSPPPFTLGKANLIHQAKSNKPQLAILAYGTTVYLAHKALEKLQKQGYDISLYDARFAKPVDIQLIQSLIKNNTPILTIEDHAINSGYGTCVLEAANSLQLNTQNIHRIGIPEKWFHQDSRDNQLKDAGLDPESIAQKARNIIQVQVKDEDPPAVEPTPTQTPTITTKTTQPKSKV